jgi:hypothetical protein
MNLYHFNIFCNFLLYNKVDYTCDMIFVFYKHMNACYKFLKSNYTLLTQMGLYFDGLVGFRLLVYQLESSYLSLYFGVFRCLSTPD